MVKLLKSTFCTLFFVAVTLVAQAQGGYVLEGRVTNVSDNKAIAGGAIIVDGGDTIYYNIVRLTENNLAIDKVKLSIGWRF